MVGLWWVLIGLFLRNAAQLSKLSLVLNRVLKGESVRQCMTRDPVLVPPYIKIDQLVEQYFLKYHFVMFPVMNGRQLCCISISEIQKIPQQKWADHTVVEFAKPCSAENSVSIDDDALKAITIMRQTRKNRLMVIDTEERLVGVLALPELLKFLSLKLKSQGTSASALPDIEDSDEHSSR